MSATKEQIRFSILDTVKPNNISGEPITDELIDFHIKNIRAQLIKQDINKGAYIDSAIVQSLGCVPFVQADESECCAYPTGCTILRTNVPIPTAIQVNGRNLITRVGPVSLSEKPWQQVEFERVPFEGTNRFTKHLIKWFIPNNSQYVYLLINNQDYLTMGIEVGSIQGVWDDPDQLVNFTNCATGEACFSDSSPYPIKDWMIPALQEMIIKKFVLLEANQPIDKTNDSNSNPETTIQKGV